MKEWKWIGHNLRKEEGEVVKMDFDWNLKGQRRRGRPRASDGLARHGERPR